MQRDSKHHYINQSRKTARQGASNIHETTHTNSRQWLQHGSNAASKQFSWQQCSKQYSCKATARRKQQARYSKHAAIFMQTCREAERQRQHAAVAKRKRERGSTDQFQLPLRPRCSRRPPPRRCRAAAQMQSRCRPDAERLKCFLSTIQHTQRTIGLVGPEFCNPRCQSCRASP
jgi:hypothetical protein